MFLQVEDYIIKVEDNSTGMQPAQLEELKNAGNKQMQSTGVFFRLCNNSTPDQAYQYH